MLLLQLVGCMLTLRLELVGFILTFWLVHESAGHAAEAVTGAIAHGALAGRRSALQDDPMVNPSASLALIALVQAAGLQILSCCCGACRQRQPAMAFIFCLQASVLMHLA